MDPLIKSQLLYQLSYRRPNRGRASNKAPEDTPEFDKSKAIAIPGKEIITALR